MSLTVIFFVNLDMIELSYRFQTFHDNYYNNIGIQLNYQIFEKLIPRTTRHNIIKEVSLCIKS